MSLLKELVKNLQEADSFEFGGGEVGGTEPDMGANSAAADVGAAPAEEPIGDEEQSDENPEDAVAMDVPLLIRIMEWAHEEAKTDVELHRVAENLVAMSEEGRTLSMEDYDAALEGVAGDEEDVAGMGNDDEFSDEDESGYGDQGSMPVAREPGNPEPNM